MTSPHSYAERHARAVQAIQRLTLAEPSVISVSRAGNQLHAVASPLDPDKLSRFGAPAVLREYVPLIQRDPGMFDDVYGFGLALPDKHIAYFLDLGGVFSILPIGPTPKDHVRTRTAVIDALTQMLRAGPAMSQDHKLDTLTLATTGSAPEPPARRGKPFPEPPASVSPDPNTPPTSPPASASGEHARVRRSR